MADFAIADKSSTGIAIHVDNLLNLFLPNAQDLATLRGTGNAKLADSLELLKNNVRKMLSDFNSVVSISRIYDPHTAGEHSYSTASDEFVHVKQVNLAGTTDHSGVNPNASLGKAYLNSPQMAKATAHIAANYSWYIGEEASEVPAWVLSGDAKRMGLDQVEAKALVESYARALIEAHGLDGAESMFEYMLMSGYHPQAFHERDTIARGICTTL